MFKSHSICIFFTTNTQFAYFSYMPFWRRKGNPLQGSCLENPIDRGAWQATIHGVTRVGHDLGTKPPYAIKSFVLMLFICQINCNSFCDISCKDLYQFIMDLGLIHGLGRSPGEENSYPLQYLGLRIPCPVQSMKTDCGSDGEHLPAVWETWV